MLRINSCLRGSPCATIALAVLVAGCGGGRAPATQDAVPIADPCLVGRRGEHTRDTVLVVLEGPIRSQREPVIPTPAERFLAGQLNQTGVVADCAGRARSGVGGTFRMVSSDPWTLAPSPGVTGPTVVLHVAPPGADPRDLIDRGADLVITTDRRTLDYAADRPDLHAVPLAWSATYVLIAPPGSTLPVEPTADFLSALVRDVVRADARPAEPPFWWDDDRCPGPAAGTDRTQTGIVISDQDPTARAIAERLVALGVASGPRRVVPLPPARLDSALARGDAGGFVVSLPRLPPTECGERSRVPDGFSLAALVDVRAAAIFRPGVPAFLIDARGSVLFLPGVTP